MDPMSLAPRYISPVTIIHWVDAFYPGLNTFSNSIEEVCAHPLWIHNIHISMIHALFYTNMQYFSMEKKELFTFPQNCLQHFIWYPKKIHLITLKLLDICMVITIQYWVMELNHISLTYTFQCKQEIKIRVKQAIHHH